MQRALTFWIGLAVVLLISRGAHVNVLWADEDYHLAVAIQALLGKVPYRDVWYDKPPLNALVMMLTGGWPGWPLRILSVGMELAVAAVAYRFASRVWSARVGYIAATAFVFYHVFYFASTAIPLEPDTFMILPHLLAVYWAWERRPGLAGLAAGAAFLLNTKGLFVLMAAFVFYPAGWLWLGAGFVAAVAPMAAWLVMAGALPGYLEQVWQWGFLYAANPPPEPFVTPLVRLGNWMAFHAALVLGGVLGWAHIETRLRWTLLGWLGVSLAAAMIGWRLPAHYLHQLFPALVLFGACGLAGVGTRGRVWQVLVLAAVLIPLVRFTPRYVELLAEDWRGAAHGWRDVSMDQESRGAAEMVRGLARPGDTLFIWGYRPNIAVYTRLAVTSALWESQPVTMVPADRHLGSTESLDPKWAARNQAKLVETSPTWIVDGLSAYNRGLDLRVLVPLREWFQHYCEVGAVRGTTVYRRCR